MNNKEEKKKIVIFFIEFVKWILGLKKNKWYFLK